jgi:sec-independent protein translocase protein TatB
MFDIGFSEMIVIAVIALIVLGPEKLPRVARTAGHLLGRMQRYVNDVKSDINREIELDELRKLQKEMEKTAQSIESTVKGEINAVETEVKQVTDNVQKTFSDPLVDAFADPTPVQPVQPAAAAVSEAPEAAPRPAAALAEPAAPSAQLELNLDAAVKPNAPPPASAKV